MSKSRDPVCDMEIEVGSAAATREYQGETLYFCSPGCVTNFDADPARYVRQPSAGKHSERTYICPMHPEVVSDKPGNCPNAA